MTREEALRKAINIVRYFEAHFAKSKEAREDAVNIIEALEQKPCEDAISRQAVIEQTYNWSQDEFLRTTNAFDHLRRKIKALPSVMPRPKMGRWIESHIPESTLCECSVCGFSCGAYSFNFCPACGAKMKESEDEK